MPRVKVVRDNRMDSPKKIATRSRDKIKTEIEKKLSSVPIPKGKRIIQVPKAKSLTSVGQQKQKDVRGNQENRKKAHAAGNMKTDGFTDYNKTVKQNTKQKGMVIYVYDDSQDSDDDGKDSQDDNENNSADDYEPDTEDEEEYRSRSYYW